MRITLSQNDEDEGVPMSPLIDCVFLLLIFFLVTTMLKKWEMQVPIRMPDITSSLSQDANEDVYRIAVDESGSFYVEGEKGPSGFPRFYPVENLGLALTDLADRRSVDLPLRLMAERDAPFQTVLGTLDLCQEHGFTNTDLKLINGRVRVLHHETP